MTTQEYLNKIEVLQNDKNASFDNANLEFCIQKMQQNRIELSFTFDDLFRKSDSPIVTLNYDLLKQLASYLGLSYVDEQESGNVCFAESPEVRPEFRLSFRTIDFLDYSYAFMHSSFYKESQKIIISPDVHLFWEMIRIGAGFRKESN